MAELSYGGAVREADWTTSKAIQILRLTASALMMLVVLGLVIFVPSERAEGWWSIIVIAAYLVVHLLVATYVWRRPLRLRFTIALAAFDCAAIVAIYLGHFLIAPPPRDMVQQYYEPVVFLALTSAGHSLHYSWRPGVSAASAAILGYVGLAIVRGYPWNFAVFGVVVLVFTGAIAVLGARTLRRLLSRAVGEALSRQRLGRYLPALVADRIAQDAAAPRPGGEKIEITVLVVDLRGSTGLAAKLGAEGYVALLNDLYVRAVREVFAEAGTLDKFLGDGLLVFFGAPSAQPDHAARAVRCALRIQESFTAWNRERAEKGEPAAEVVCGIHTGEAIVGNVGTAERLEHTAHGETVHLASRVEGMCRTLEATVLATGATAQQLPEGAFRLTALGEHTLRGVERPFPLFRVEPASTA